ncbi:MAG TPA: ubiquinol-cytochrome c reductase iron-sulfur subunit [Gammaproteobacteria bacterium]
MDTNDVDQDRRRFLTVGAGVVGAAGVAVSSVPFLASLAPSEKAKAEGAPVEFDISKLAPGMKVTVEWRKRPVFIVRRTPAMLASLEQLEPQLVDPNSQKKSQQPEYAQNRARSINPEYLVMLGVCTHLGCSPTFRPDVAPQDLGETWKGGFFCPCHGSKFDLAGRVYKGVPAPTNMAIPPYHYISDTVIRIGEDQEKA